MFETWCPACMMQHHTRERLLYHLTRAVRCAVFVRSLDPMSAERSDEMDREAAKHETALRRAGLCRRKAARPAYRLTGPVPKPVAAELPAP